MNFVVLGVGRSVGVAGFRLPAAALLACLACNVWALSAAPDEIIVAQAFAPTATDRTRPQVELSSSSLPRFDNTDGATRSSRIDMTLLAPTPSAFGPALGMTSSDARAASGGRPFASGSTAVDLGVHWRYTSDANYRFDVTAWRRMNPADAASLIQNRESSYGARVEMRVASAPRSGFVADHRFLGIQLESGARITLRKSGGKPMVYYRSSF